MHKKQHAQIFCCLNQPSWRHLPHLDNQSMIAYRESDVYFTWSHEKGKGDTDTWPRTCSYVREEEEEEEEEEEDEGEFPLV
jgi:disintegrin and metalloproteinase domain-containing protein 17